MLVAKKSPAFAGLFCVFECISGVKGPGGCLRGVETRTPFGNDRQKSKKQKQKQGESRATAEAMDQLSAGGAVNHRSKQGFK